MKNTPKHSIVTLIMFVGLLASSSSLYAQKSKGFHGLLEYRITPRDTALRELIPENKMLVYTNDTISRMENFSEQLGPQVNIRHMELNKSYLLVTVQDSVDFAIKTDLNIADSLKPKSEYQFEKKCFKTKFNGHRANRVMATNVNFKEPIEFLYLKKYDNKYLNNFEHSPGLLIRFSIATPDGILDYELIKMSEFNPNRDLFGIPDNYKKVTLDEFFDYLFPESAPPR